MEFLAALIDALGRASLILLALGVTAVALLNLRRHYLAAIREKRSIAGEAWQAIFFAVVVGIIALAGSGNASASIFFKENGEAMGLLFSGVFGIWLTYKGHGARVKAKAEASQEGKDENDG